MPPAFPKEVREAVWAMRCDGMMPSEITRAVNDGCEELAGIAYPVKRATVVSWLERFYKDRGKPEENIPQGTELDVANAELRKILTWARAKRKEVMERDGKLDSDVATMTKLTGLIAGTEKAIRESRATKDPDAVAAGKTTKRPDRGILSKIAKDERLSAQSRKPAPYDAGSALPDASDESPQPSRPDPELAPQPEQGTNPYGTSGVGFPD